jgi:hypothetical protein
MEAKLLAFQAQLKDYGPEQDQWMHVCHLGGSSSSSQLVRIATLCRGLVDVIRAASLH